MEELAGRHGGCQLPLVPWSRLNVGVAGVGINLPSPRSPRLRDTGKGAALVCASSPDAWMVAQRELDAIRERHRFGALRLRLAPVGH